MPDYLKDNLAPPPVVQAKYMGMDIQKKNVRLPE